MDWLPDATRDPHGRALAWTETTNPKGVLGGYGSRGPCKRSGPLQMLPAVAVPDVLHVARGDAEVFRDVGVAVSLEHPVEHQPDIIGGDPGDLVCLAVTVPPLASH